MEKKCRTKQKKGTKNIKKKKLKRKEKKEENYSKNKYKNKTMIEKATETRKKKYFLYITTMITELFSSKFMT